MPTTYTSTQCETPTHIAKQYRFGSCQKIHNHSNIVEFRAACGNPNFIYPDDEIIEASLHSEGIFDTVLAPMGTPETDLELYLKAKNKSGTIYSNFN